MTGGIGYFYDEEGDFPEKVRYWGWFLRECGLAEVEGWGVLLMCIATALVASNGAAHVCGLLQVFFVQGGGRCYMPVQHAELPLHQLSLC
jgi:hypothetical protein